MASAHSLSDSLCSNCNRRALSQHLVLLWEGGLLRPSHVDRCLRLAAGEPGLAPGPVTWPAPAAAVPLAAAPRCDAWLMPQEVATAEVRFPPL